MTEHNLSTVLEQMTVPENEPPEVTVPENEPPEVTAKVQRLMIVIGFGLHGIQPKIDYIKETPLCAGKWVVFLNKAGNLAHAMHADEVEDGTYVRMRVAHNLKNAHENYVRRYFYNRMIARYVI